MNLTEKYLTIKDLPNTERPREKLLEKGPCTLSVSELLAILLRTGTRNETAIHLAERLIAEQGGLSGLAAMPPEEMSKFKGIGQAKAVSIIAAIELGRRISALLPDEKPIIRRPQDAADLLMGRLRHEAREHFMAILLSTKNHVLRIAEISIGSLNASIVHPRELFKEALRFSAASIILVHNHPSGDPNPSREDVSITRQLIEAGELLEIKVLDHVIIGDGKYVSMKDKGII